MDWSTRRDRLPLDRLRAVAVTHWQADLATVTLVNAGVNVIVRFVDVSGRVLYLRAAHPSIRTQQQTRAAYAFMQHAAGASVPVCEVVLAKTGEMMVSVDFDDFYATVVSGVPGAPMPLDVTDTGVFAAWGRALGQLHRAAATYTPADGITYSTFTQFWENVRPVVPHARPGIQRVYAELDDWLRTLPPDDIILTHGDYRPGNVIWDGRTAWTIDFDEPVYHWAITDVARALLEYGVRPHAERQAIKAAFLRGYRSVRPLDPVWVARLPKLMQLRGTIMHLWDVQGLADDGTDANTDWALDWALKPVAW